MAKRIGLKREWFQADGSKPHYDLTPPRRTAAIAAGAVELDRAGMRAFFERWRKAVQP